MGVTEGDPAAPPRRGRPARDQGAPPTRRVQMDLAPRPLERLQRLQARIEASSYGETVRRSLWLHETLLDLAGPDGRILVERDGVLTPVQLVGMDA